jgi:sugar/nucleoside kinase (ribokinase family)
VGECFAFGSKIDVTDVVFDTGGSATNTAATFSNLGFRVGACTRIGADTAGDAIRKALEAFSVDTRLLITDPKRHSGYSVILVSGVGDRTVLVHRGAAEHFSAQEMPWDRMRASWWYVGSVAGNVALLKKIFSIVKKNAIQVAWNPGAKEIALGLRRFAPFLRSTDVFMLNREEAEALIGKKADTNDLLATLQKKTGGLVVITDGKNGSVARHGTTIYAVPATNDKPVNTTGAGDAYGSGLVAGLLHELSTEDALRVATINSGSVVTKTGAKNGILSRWPTAAEMKKVHVVTSEG